MAVVFKAFEALSPSIPSGALYPPLCIKGKHLWSIRNHHHLDPSYSSFKGAILAGGISLIWDVRKFLRSKTVSRSTRLYSCRFRSRCVESLDVSGDVFSVFFLRVNQQTLPSQTTTIPKISLNPEHPKSINAVGGPATR